MTAQADVGKTPTGSKVCCKDNVRPRAALTAVEETRPDACQAAAQAAAGSWVCFG